MKLKKILGIHVALICVAPPLSHAASFQILEQSPAQLGKAFAGSGSDIQDATTVFFNPAGMSQFNSNSVSVGFNLIQPQASFQDEGSTTGGVTGKTDEGAVVPNLYAVTRLDDRWSFGVGVNAPYGMSSSYPADWIGRYLATDSELEVLNINATAAFTLNEQWAFGLGINYQRMEVTLESAFDSSFGAAPTPETDSYASIKGDDTDLVADLSMYWQPTNVLSFGLIWRQGGAFDLTGEATFTLDETCSPEAGLTPEIGAQCQGALTALAGAVASSVELPDTITLSGSYQLNQQWAIHADIAQTQWSSIEQVVVTNTNSESNAPPVSVLDLQYDNTQRISLGTSFRPDDVWQWRFGVALDEAPQTDPSYITPRIPDGDRTWLSAGFNYQWNEAFSVDVAYTHIAVDDAEIDDTSATPSGNEYQVLGSFDSKVDIFAVQFNWAY